MIMSLTFAQIMTFVSFNIMSITQNARFFELEPTGTEDNPLSEPMELILERDLRKNTWNAFLIQFFLDIGRFSVGAAEVCYKEEYRHVRVAETKSVPQAFGNETQETTNNFQALPVFVGNRVYPVSPYRFFPDTRLPLTRYQEGEFCGSEDQFSLSALRGLGSDLFNLDKIPKYTEDDYKRRQQTSRIDLGLPDKGKNANLAGFGNEGDVSKGSMVKSGPVVVDKIVFDMIPKNFSEDHPNAISIGDEDFPVRYLAWYANDGTIIRFEEAYYLHCQFPYICAQYLPDQHKTINEGLADICSQITDLITWLINAHVMSQKNSVLSKFIVDPAGIDTKTLDSTNPYIFLKKNAGLTGIDRYIKQMVTTDVTQNVMSDVASLKDMLELITGNSAQMQGQYSQGRRSATQDRVVAQGAGARGKTTLGGIWDTAFEPLGKQLIANNRQEMDFETFARIMGVRSWPINPATVPTPDILQQAAQTGQPAPQPRQFTIQEIFTLFKSDAVGIATSEDFFVFDGTQPSEKAFLAQSMQEILMQIFQNPEVAQVLGYGPEQVQELFNQVYLLRGVTPARMPKGTPQPMPQEQQGGQQAPPSPKELISVALPDLAGDERTQALALFGIRADNGAHEKQLKVLHPPKTATSNGSSK